MILAGYPLGAEVLGNSQRGLEEAVDQSGHGHHGRYLGTPLLGRASLIPGEADPCVGLDGDDDLIFVGDHADFSFPANTFAIEFWFTPSALAALNEGIVGKWGDAFEYSIIFQTGALQFTAWNQAAAIVYNNVVAVADLDPHYYVWTADGANARVYVDAVLIQTAAKTAGVDMADTAAALVLGLPGPVTSVPTIQLFTADQLCQLAEATTLDQGSLRLSTLTDDLTMANLAEAATVDALGGVTPTGSEDLTMGALGETATIAATPSNIIAVTASDAFMVGVFEPYHYEDAIATSDPVPAHLDELSGGQENLGPGLTETATLEISGTTDPTGSDSLTLGGLVETATVDMAGSIPVTGSENLTGFSENVVLVAKTAVSESLGLHLDELSGGYEALMGLAESASVSTSTP